MTPDSSMKLAGRLAEDWAAGRVASVTWMNHYSALRLLAWGMTAIAPIDYVGIDGLFLHRLLRQPGCERTTADLVIPRLLPLLHGARIALVGGERASLNQAAKAIADKFLVGTGSSIVDTRDGYEELPAGDGIEPWLDTFRPDVVIVGLGAVLQDQWAIQVRSRLPRGLVLTCGGFLDQVHQPNYYPWWSYTLRLNWAVRFVREPRRLWRRYTVDAVTAVRLRQELSKGVKSLPGFDACCEGSEDRLRHRLSLS